MMKQNKGKSEFIFSKENNDELNLLFLFKSFFRNKRIISFFSIVFFLFFSIYNFSREKIWEGEFVIVLDKEKNPFELAETFGLNTNLENNLKTEIGILESPSVLMPVFNYVKSLKGSKEGKIYFTDWKESNLNIKLKKATSILTIRYFDKNKDLILPVLNRISNAYQEYSGKNERRSLEIQKNYLSEQINIYKTKSNKSINDAQKYAMENNLLFNNSDLLKNLLDKNKKSESNVFKLPTNIGGNYKLDSTFITDSQINNSWYSSLNNMSMENIRVRSANEIKNIDLQIKKIEDLGNDSKKLQYIGLTIPGLVREGLPQLLRDMDNELILLKTKYMDNDFSIKLINDKRDIYIKLLKERAIQYLNAQRLSAEALMESASRPGDVIMEYKRLLRNAAMDENTLIDLENKLRYTKLSAAKISDPWELITKPTIIQRSDFKQKVLKSILGLFSGILIGFIIAFIKEKKSDLIYEEKDLKDIFNSEIFEKINLNNKTYSVNTKEILINEIFKKYLKNKMVFIKSKSISPENTNQFFRLIFEEIGNLKIKDTFDLIQNEEEVILLTTLGTITNEEAVKINNRLKMINKKVKGIILIVC